MKNQIHGEFLECEGEETNFFFLHIINYSLCSNI